MATIIAQNSAEGFTNGVTPTTGNSGGASGTAWDVINANGNPISASSGRRMHGALSYRFEQVSGFNTLNWTSSLGSNLADVSSRCYFYLEAMPTNVVVITKGYTDIACTQNAWAVTLLPDGRISLFDANNVMVYRSDISGPLVAAGAWYRLETSVIAGTSGRIALYSGDSASALWDSGLSTDFSPDTTNAVRYGIGASNTGIGVLWMDDMAVGTGGLIGPLGTVIPSAVLAENNAEGLTNGATVTTGNSGGTSGTAWDVVNANGNPVTADTAKAMHGTKSYKLVQTSGFNTLNWVGALSGAPLSTTSTRTYFNVAAIPTATTVLVKGYADAAYSLNSWAVSLTTSGRLYIQDADNTTRYLSPAGTGIVSADTWYRLETSVIASTSSRIALYTGDSTTPLWDSGVVTGFSSSATSAVRFGFGTSNSGIGSLWLDDLAVGSSGLIGPVGSGVTPTGIIAQNTAEGLSNGTTPTSANSGDSSGDAWDVINRNGNPITADTSQAMHGTKSYKFVQTSGFNTLNWNSALSGAPLSSVSMRTYFNLAALPTTPIVLVKGYSDAACTVGAWVLTVQTSGRVITSDANNTSRYQSPAGTGLIAANTWYRLETLIIAGASSRTLLYAGDSTTALWDSGVVSGFSAGTTSAVRFGFGTSATGIGTLWMDDMAVGNGTLIGPSVASTGQAPVASVSANQSSQDGASVTLSGSATNAPTSYSWTQISGPPVTLTGRTTTACTFTAPVQPTASTLVFGFTATNGIGTSPQVTTQVAVAAHTLWMQKSGSLLPLNSNPDWPRMISAPPAGYTPPNYGAFGTYKPSNATTGHLTPRGSLTPYNVGGGTLVITTDNQVFEGLEIFGDIQIKARNTTFQDCLFRGPKTWKTNDAAIITCTYSEGYNTLVQDCTFEPILPQYYRNAMIGHEYTALRCRSYWVNDHYGVYSQTGLNKSTNVKIAGCYMTDNVYWHGNTAQYPGQSTANTTVNLPDGGTYSVPPYPIKVDGTHNDGIQIQGGLGGSKSIWCIGNFINLNDAVQTDPHPTGLATPIPKLGTQDNHKRFDYKTNTPQVMRNGQYAANGQAIMVQQNTYKFPQIETVVVENNWVNASGTGISIQAHSGGNTKLVATVRNNKFGESIYVYVPTNPSTYPIRVDWRADATVSGLATNTWYESYWRPAGSALIEGRTSGIRYDN